MSYPPPGPSPYPDAPFGYGFASQPPPRMGMGEAVSSVLTKYATFSGRARRSEHWWFVLAYSVVNVVASIVDAQLGSAILEVVLVLALLVPGLAVMVRRLHDIGRSAWWALIGLVPLVGGIVLLVFACQDSNVGTNKYGPSPKYS
jgi:uncharacterized membrane protein YhaH (DUF805 family)